MKKGVEKEKERGKGEKHEGTRDRKAGGVGITEGQGRSSMDG